QVITGLLERADGPRERLSPREQEVMELMAHGRSNTAIAQALFVTEKQSANTLPASSPNWTSIRNPTTTGESWLCCGTYRTNSLRFCQILSISRLRMLQNDQYVAVWTRHDEPSASLGLLRELVVISAPLCFANP